MGCPTPQVALWHRGCHQRFSPISQLILQQIVPEVHLNHLTQGELQAFQCHMRAPDQSSRWGFRQGRREPDRTPSAPGAIDYHHLPPHHVTDGSSLLRCVAMCWPRTYDDVQHIATLIAGETVARSEERSTFDLALWFVFICDRIINAVDRDPRGRVRLQARLSSR